MTVGRGGTTTHDYKRHGTTDLFAAMNVAAGEVLSDARRSHNCQQCLGVLQGERPARVEGSHRRRRARQPFGPQGPAGGQMVGRPEASLMAPALHADFVVPAAPHRTTLGELTEGRSVEACFTSVPAPHRGHRDMGRAPERRSQAVRLAQDRAEIIKKVRRGQTSLSGVKSTTHH